MTQALADKLAFEANELALAASLPSRLSFNMSYKLAYAFVGRAQAMLQPEGTSKDAIKLLDEAYSLVSNFSLDEDDASFAETAEQVNTLMSKACSLTLQIRYTLVVQGCEGSYAH